jgi:hypothetical protein
VQTQQEVQLTKLSSNFLAVGFLFALSSQGLAAECGMNQIATHGDKDKTKIYASSSGFASLYYQANMDVNTDGAAKSYHPDDPRGRKIAYNNIANAIERIFDATGKDITCSPRQGPCFDSFIKTFEAARDARYNPKGTPRFTTGGMIPWQKDTSLGWDVPCTNKDSPFEGYFVSQTSIMVDPKKEICDQSRYLDSFAINAVVLPKGVKWSAQGTATDGGDMVVVRDAGSGRVAYAINGDTGPATVIGEGTIALTAALAGVKLTGKETYTEIRKLARPNVQYVTFPKDDIRKLVGVTYTQADINKVGEELFNRWGGVERLDACGKSK